jgi:predicted ATP-grasp superfamily ATP-dependent carboligase
MRREGKRRRGIAALNGDAEVLIVTAESRTGLAAARSLERNGVPFVVVGFDANGLIATSRHVGRHVIGPSPSEPEAFIDFLASAVRRTGAAVVLPVDDVVLRVCDRHRSVLADVGATLAAAGSPAVQAVLDKRANLALARRLGIPCPSQFEIERIDQLPELVERIGFPMVLKPPSAYAFGADRTFSFKWLVARDERELRALLERYCPGDRFPMFQELVAGHVVGLYCFASAGELVALHAAKALRRSIGQNVYREIVPVDPTLAGYARTLLGELSWDGVATLAFFVTRGGVARYMETNGRLWGTVEGSINAGWDFPYWQVRYFQDGVVPDPPPIAIGSRCCWRVGDYVALRCALRGEEWLTDRQNVGRLRAMSDYVACFRPGVHSDVFRLDDPLPEFVEHWQLARDAIRRRTRRAKRRPTPHG